MERDNGGEVYIKKIPVALTIAKIQYQFFNQLVR